MSPQSGMCRRRFGIAALFATLAACAHVPPLGLKAPEVRASDIQLKEIGLKQIRFILSVDAFNPNSTTLPLSGLKVDLDLLGQPFAQGAGRDAYFELPANATTRLPIEFVVTTARLRDLLRNFRPENPAAYEYTLRGSAHWGTDGMLMPFERRGELASLRRLAELLGH